MSLSESSGSCTTSDSSEDESENVELMRNTKRSVVWDFFTETMKENVKCAQCNECRYTLTIRKGTTTPCFNHLKTKHPDVYVLCEAEQQKRKRRDEEQAPPKRRRGEMSDEKKKEIDLLITRLIVLDLEPFRIVNRRGFRELLEYFAPEYSPADRTHISRDLLPELFETVKRKVEQEISDDVKDGIHCIAFTTDGWTSDAGHAYLSLTRHYLTSNFELKNFMLGLRHVDKSHTAAVLAATLESILEEWSLELPNIPKYFVTDNANNITAAISQGGWNNIYCFPHTLNLSLKDAREATLDLDKILTKARRIVTHFSHSEPARRALNNAQLERGVKNPLKLIQMVPTRFNSEYFMLNRMVQVKKSLTVAISNTTLKETLSGHEWDELEKVVEILEPLNHATQEASGNEYPTFCMVIPLIRGITHRLQRLREKWEPESLAVKFCEELEVTISARFPQLDEQMKATFLDPRFKGSLLDEEGREGVEDLLLDETEVELMCSSQSVSSQNQSNCSQQSTHSIETDFWGFMDLPEIKAKTSSSNDRKTVLKQEIAAYRSAPTCGRRENPLDWWRINSALFPNLAQLAQKYLTLPASSIDSERLFSTCGEVDDDKRAKLLPENMEMIIFLNKNL